MIEKFKNVLVLAPHTDDGELGAGGTISKLSEAGAKITYVAFSTCAESVPDGHPKNVLEIEVRNATRKLGINEKNLIILDYQVRNFSNERQNILDDLIGIKSKDEFDLVLTPSLQDIHQDHSTISIESLRAFKNTSILGYELPWNNLSFDLRCFVELEEKHLDQKLNALDEYKSQAGRSYLSRDITISLAKSCGVKCGCNFAESFEVIRLFL